MMSIKILIPFLIEVGMGLFKGHPYDEDREKRNRSPVSAAIFLVMLAGALELGNYTLGLYDERSKLQLTIKQVKVENTKKLEISKMKLEASKAKADRLESENKKLLESLEECRSKKSASLTLSASLEKKLQSCDTARGNIDLDDINKRLKGGKNL